MSIRKRTWTTAKEQERTAFLLDYKDATGKRRVEQFPTRALAKARQDEIGADMRSGIHVARAASITVAEAADNWLEARRTGSGERDKVEPATLAGYKRHVEQHIKPRLGTFKLADLKTQNVTTFQNHLLKNGMSRALARMVVRSLKSLLTEAQRSGNVGTNVALPVKLKISSRRKGFKQVADDDENVTVEKHARIPSRAEVNTLIAKMDELAEHRDPRRSKAWRRWRALIRTAIGTGMRLSELRGLTWAAIDLDAGQISVVQKADAWGDIGPCKSENSFRTITLPTDLIGLLKTWKAEAPKGQLVFANWKGNVELTTNVHKRAWGPLQFACGLTETARDEHGNTVHDKDGKPVLRKRYTFHALRHFHASELIAAGYTAKHVSARLGHSSVAFTLDTYTHLFETGADADEERAILDAIAASRGKRNATYMQHDDNVVKLNN